MIEFVKSFFAIKIFFIYKFFFYKKKEKKGNKGMFLSISYDCIKKFLFFFLTLLIYFYDF
jgi:hypothetical protein